MKGKDGEEERGLERRLGRLEERGGKEGRIKEGKKGDVGGGGGGKLRGKGWKGGEEVRGKGGRG